MDNLVIGASGQVGQRIYRELAEHQQDVVGTCFTRSKDRFLVLDLAGPELAQLITKDKPRTIYLCAAATNVDWQEGHPDESRITNVLAVEKICDAAKLAGSKLIFLSTEYVFNGRKGWYTETEFPSPLNVCGQHKLKAEYYIQSTLPSAIIARTTWVYSFEGIGGKNFVQRIIEASRAGVGVLVPNDQFSTPTYAPELAHALVGLPRDMQGIVHLAGRDGMSKMEWALLIAEIFGLDRRMLKARETDQLLQVARRPLFAGLRSIILEPLGGVGEGLRNMKAEMGD